MCRIRPSSSGLALVVLAACGGATNRPAPPAEPPARPSGPDALDLEGQWSWTHRSDADGVRRVEREVWTLERHDDDYRGSYQRRITFLSLDGTPFRCSQTPSYRLQASFELEGRRRSDHVALRERSYRVAPSPCERGFRQLTDYRARVEDGELRLRWDDGSQSLRADPDAALGPVPAPETVAGRWRWTTRGPAADDRVRVEREDWELSDDGGGAIHGHYTRTVTVFSPDGSHLPCSEASHFTYRDRYRVQGVRSGQRVTLSEVASEPARHPCVHDPRRHLDAAVGELSGEYLVLRWRGDRTQVLHRAGPGPPSASPPGAALSDSEPRRAAGRPAPSARR